MRNPLPLGSVAGGGVERKLNGEPVVNAKAIAVDALAGAVGDAAGGPADNGTKRVKQRPQVMTPQTKRLQKVLLIGAVLTIIVTLLRRAVYVFYPNVLPSQHWHPPSLLMVRLGALLQGVSVGLMVVGVLSSTFSYILLIPRFRSLNARMIVIEGGAVALAWILLILSAGPV